MPAIRNSSESDAMRPLLLNKAKRRFLYLLSLMLLITSALINGARAGDVADRHIWGFSPDGAYFAFEEYGVQDGSGFPYSNIYITNTRQNSWVKGSPIRVLIQNEETPLSSAREAAYSRAEPLFSQYNIGDRGAVLAHNPVTEIGREAHSVKVAPGPQPFLKKYALTFQLEEAMIPTKRCKVYGDESQMSYALSVQREGEETRQLHKDSRIPTSRGCPKAYAISDILRYEPQGEKKEAIFIVIVQYFSYGFEGNDGRYLASSHWLPTFQATN